MREETKRLLAWLAAKLSSQDLQHFLEEYGGRDFYLPKPSTLARLTRDAEIRARYSAGASYAELAEEFPPRERQVRRIVHPPKRPKKAA